MTSKYFKVFIYEDELQYLKWLVLKSADNETGGDLFGLWGSDGNVVVQIILGPGRKCSRTKTTFYQDVQYLAEVREYLNASQRLCNVGEWHSHHRIGMTLPTGRDQDTVWQNIDSVDGGRFLVFIANIDDCEKQPFVNVCSFMFIAVTKEMRIGFINSLPGSSPLRLSLNDDHFKPGAEPGADWESYGVAKDETEHSLLDTWPEHGSFIPENMDKSPLKSSVKDINHNIRRKNSKSSVGKLTRLLSRSKKVDDIKSYGTFNNELNEDESSKDGKKKKTKQKVITSQPQATAILCDLASSTTPNTEESMSSNCCCIINR